MFYNFIIFYNCSFKLQILCILKSILTGIRHPEELSLCRALTSEHLKRNYPRGVGCTPRQRSKEPTAGMNLSQNNNNKSDGFLSPDTSGSATTPLNTVSFGFFSFVIAN